MKMQRLAPLALLLSLAAFAAAAAPAAEVDWSKAEPVTVIMTEYKFAPSALTFRHGVPYRLHLENQGKELHEFTAAAFFKAVTVRNPEVLKNGGQEAVVEPHETKDVYFMADRPGHFPLACADHDWEGMVGDITVE
jgi:uncharacterized cupredoxin-like copper-binding protein